MIYTHPLLAMVFIAMFFLLVGCAVRWLKRELNGDNYKDKYPHADALLKTMSKYKVDAAVADTIRPRDKKE